MGWAHDAAHQCHVAAAHILRSERCLAPLPWGHSDLMSSIIIRRGYPGGCPSQGFGAYSTKWSWEGSVGRRYVDPSDPRDLYATDCGILGLKPREGGAEDEDVGMKGKQNKGRDECVIQECVLEVSWYRGGEAVYQSWKG